MCSNVHQIRLSFHSNTIMLVYRMHPVDIPILDGWSQEKERRVFFYFKVAYYRSELTVIEQLVSVRYVLSYVE